MAGRKPEEAGGGPGADPTARGRDRKAFLLRLSPGLMADLRGWANQEFRSLNAHIEYLLREAVRRRKGGSDRG